MQSLHRLSLISLAILLMLTGCATTQTTATSAPSSPTVASPDPTATSVPPTATPVPPTVTPVPPTATETPVPTLTPTPEPSPTRPAIEELTDITYGTDQFEQTLDVYFSNEIEGPFPVVLMLHEGNGHKEQFVSWGLNFAKQGFAVVASNYRGWPGHSYPQDVSDAFCSLAWIHANAAEYNFDTRYVFVLGHSAGGTLAAMLGTVDDPTQYMQTCPHDLPTSDWVQGVVTFTGIFDYPSAAQNSSDLGSYAAALLNGRQDENPEVWDAASAITWIDGSEPPFLIFHGGGDQNIPPDQSTNFAQALQAAGVPVELVIVPEAGHYQITGSSENIEATLAFLSGLVQK